MFLFSVVAVVPIPYKLLTLNRLQSKILRELLILTYRLYKPKKTINDHLKIAKCNEEFNKMHQFSINGDSCSL